MNDEARKPGIIAWLVLDVFAAALPLLLLVLVCFINNEHLETTLNVLVGYSLVLVVALAFFITSLGTVLFHRIAVDHWQIVAGLIIAMILVGAIGVGAARYLSAGTPIDLQERTVWLLLQVAVLLGVLFYSSALKSWMLQKLLEKQLSQ
jgi:hypothetical protein